MAVKSKMEGMVDQLKMTFQNRRVLITGHTGFKGSWLVGLMHELGANIAGYALDAEEGNLYARMNGDQFCESTIGDLMDYERLSDTILSYKPDFIFHMAAQPLVLDGYQRPLYTFNVNGMGTAHVLEACRAIDHKCVLIIITTDKVYKNNEDGRPFAEADALGGHDPYSASKACTEIITESYQKSFFGNHPVKIARARAGNVIGAGDFAENRLVPDIVRALQKNETVVLRNPSAIRPWQHVLDCLMGYVQLAHKLWVDDEFYNSVEQSWNFGPNPTDKVTVEQLTKTAIKAWGEGKYEIEMADNKPHEAGVLLLDPEKSKELIGWRPVWDSRKAIEQTILGYMLLEKDSQHMIARHVMEHLNKYSTGG